MTTCLRRLGIIVAAAAAASALMVGTALAQQGWPPTATGGTTVGGGASGGTSNGGGSGGGSTGGGSYTPPPPPTGTGWTYGTYRWAQDTTYSPRSENGIADVTCARRTTPSGAPWYATGFTWRAATDGTGNAGTVPTRSTWSCTYPPQPVDRPVVCSESVTITADGPKGNPQVAERRLYGPTVTSSAWSSDRSSPTKCTQSTSAAVSLPLVDLGRYQVDAVGRMVPCTQRSYPGQERAAEIVDCRAAYSAPRRFLSQVWCGGWSRDWSGTHTFTPDECRDASGRPWTCGPTAPPTLDGLPTPVSLLRDGKTHRAVWTPVVLSGGVRNARDWTTTLTLGRNSTPAPRVGLPESAQPFAVTPAGREPGGTGRVAGQQTAYDIRWWDAGDPGRDWTAARTVGFTADFPVETITITSLDLATGAMTVAARTTTVTGTGTCPSPPLTVEVWRVRLTSQ